MRYRNKDTGYEFETASEVTAPNYELIVGAVSAPEVPKEPVKEVKKPVSSKKPAKKGARK